jgi:hypothetical protein
VPLQGKSGREFGYSLGDRVKAKREERARCIVPLQGKSGDEEGFGDFLGDGWEFY